MTTGGISQVYRGVQWHSRRQQVCQGLGRSTQPIAAIAAAAAGVAVPISTAAVGQLPTAAVPAAAAAAAQCEACDRQRGCADNLSALAAVEPST
jgi:hypothetical protein